MGVRDSKNSGRRPAYRADLRLLAPLNPLPSFLTRRAQPRFHGVRGEPHACRPCVDETIRSTSRPPARLPARMKEAVDTTSRLTFMWRAPFEQRPKRMAVLERHAADQSSPNTGQEGPKVRKSAIANPKKWIRELAAWTGRRNVILNLKETLRNSPQRITHESRCQFSARRFWKRAPRSRAGAGSLLNRNVCAAPAIRTCGPGAPGSSIGPKPSVIYLFSPARPPTCLFDPKPTLIR